MIEIKLEDKILTEALNSLTGRLKNTKPLMVAIGAELQTQTDQNLKAGVGADGNKFKPWSESWKEQRRKMKKSKGQILLLRGNLARSISRKVTNNSVIIGSNVKYARIHQLGGQAGRGRKTTISARPYLPYANNRLQQGVEKNLFETVMIYLSKPR